MSDIREIKNNEEKMFDKYVLKNEDFVPYEMSISDLLDMLLHLEEHVVYDLSDLIKKDHFKYINDPLFFLDKIEQVTDLGESVVLCPDDDILDQKLHLLLQRTIKIRFLNDHQFEVLYSPIMSNLSPPLRIVNYIWLNSSDDKKSVELPEELLSLDNYITTSMLYDTDSNGHYFLTEAGKKLSRHINSSINFVS